MLKKIMNHWKAILLTIIVVLIARHYLIAYYHAPKLNPKPKYFLTIQGTVASEFRNKGHLVFIASYVTTKDACFHETNILAGMIEGQSKTKYYWIKTDKNNNYKIKIPLDKYLPGVCGWLPSDVSMDFVKQKKNANEFAFTTIDPSYSQKYNAKTISYICSKVNLDSCKLKVNDNKNAGINLKFNQSYTVNFNILYKKG